jgi:glyoxylase-like metal-dependent hydrolase (beta-lactamase superfamily II)
MAEPDDKHRLEPGIMRQVSPLVRRLICDNGGPFTATGTCTYVVGHGEVAVIDPGPDDHAHLQRLLAALGHEQIRHIVITHTHKDHSPGARWLQERTGAHIVGCAPHSTSRALGLGEVNPLDASADKLHAPEQILGPGDTVVGPDYALTAISTPGHTANHLAFALEQEQALFSGDHVMAWSTSIVAPPDGSMAQYMASLETLRERTDAIYWPGHGGPAEAPQSLVRSLINHRRAREAAILTAISEGRHTIALVVEKVYATTPPRLHAAAALSVYAHLEDMVTRGLVTCDGPPTLTSHYRAG